MDAPDFLDWNYSEATFSGLLEEWCGEVTT
jgi:hypothetical protein